MKWKTIHLFLHTFCRYFLASMILTYAFAKIYETQFTSQPSVYDRPVSFLNGFELTWYYYGYSSWYPLVIAGVQILSAILLFFRRTTRAGVLLFLSFIVNILLVDFAYEIKEAQGIAVVLTVMAIFLLVSDYRVFLKLFIEQPPLFEDKDRPNWLNKVATVKFLLIGLAFGGAAYFISEVKLVHDDFFGKWENTENSDRIYFEKFQTFQIFKACEPQNYVYGRYLVKSDSITLQVLDENTPESVVDFEPYIVDYLKGTYHMKNDELIIRSQSDTLRFKKKDFGGHASKSKNGRS